MGGDGQTESVTTQKSNPPKTLRRAPRSHAVFQLLTCNLACLSIAALYYAWRDIYTHRRRRIQLRERVSYMLWVAANRIA